MTSRKIFRFSQHPSERKNNKPFAAEFSRKKDREDSPQTFTSNNLDELNFQQNKFAAEGLQLKQKWGTISPMEHAQLGTLQAKMEEFWVRRDAQTAHINRDFDGIAARSAEQFAASQSPSKLTLGQPDDKYERQADRVADVVTRQIHARVNAQQETTPSEGQSIRRMPSLQRDGEGGATVSSEVESQINRARGSGQPLDGKVKESMGGAMGANFDGVKVHTDGTADRLNQQLNSRAFTTGPDVFFKRGEYRPGSSEGDRLIAHELTHVVQQGEGIQKKDACIQRKLEKQHLNIVGELHAESDDTSKTNRKKLEQEYLQEQLDEEVEMKTEAEMIYLDRTDEDRFFHFDPIFYRILQPIAETLNLQGEFSRKIKEKIGNQDEEKNEDNDNTFTVGPDDYKKLLAVSYYAIVELDRLRNRELTRFNIEKKVSAFKDVNSSKLEGLFKVPESLQKAIDSLQNDQDNTNTLETLDKEVRGNIESVLKILHEICGEADGQNYVTKLLALKVSDLDNNPDAANKIVSEARSETILDSAHIYQAQDNEDKSRTIVLKVGDDHRQEIADRVENSDMSSQIEKSKIALTAHKEFNRVLLDWILKKKSWQTHSLIYPFVADSLDGDNSLTTKISSFLTENIDKHTDAVKWLLQGWEPDKIEKWIEQMKSK